MILVFDLDNTLYDETAYVRSGFLAVARHVERVHGIPASRAFKDMWNTFRREGRGHVFDLLLLRHGAYSKKNVRSCLSVYRLHRPAIVLDPDAARCLSRLRRYPIYIVTDGNKIVQMRKIRALGLEKIAKKIYITHQHGRKNAKPSPFCFRKIAAMERVPNSDVVYIGDDPHKDFVGLKPLGFKTIRVLKGPHKRLRVQRRLDAEAAIRDLDALDGALMVFLRGAIDG